MTKTMTIKQAEKLISTFASWETKIENIAKSIESKYNIDTDDYKSESEQSEEERIYWALMRAVAGIDEAYEQATLIINK